MLDSTGGLGLWFCGRCLLVIALATGLVQCSGPSDKTLSGKVLPLLHSY